MTVCIKSRTMANKLTEGHITPVFKKWNKMVSSNYRVLLLLALATSIGGYKALDY